MVRNERGDERELDDVAWEALGATLAEEPLARAGWEALTEQFAGLWPGPRWQTLRLPFEEDLEHLELWLLEAVEAHGADRDPLWFRLRWTQWYERLDGCDLELYAGPPSSEFAQRIEPAFAKPASGATAPSEVARAHRAAGSAVLAKLVATTNTWHELSVTERAFLALAAASLLVQSLIDRLDARVLLGEGGSRKVSVGFDGGPGVTLGERLHDAWNRTEFGRYG